MILKYLIVNLLFNNMTYFINSKIIILFDNL